MTPEILSPETGADVARLRKLEKLLDRQFTLAGISFGIDSVIGLVPVIGDLITAALGFYLIQEGKRLGVSKFTLARMYGNWGIDVTVGAIPVFGDLFDLAFKSNTRNLRLLIAHLEKREARIRQVGASSSFARGRKPRTSPELQVKMAKGRTLRPAPSHVGQSGSGGSQAALSATAAATRGSGSRST